MISITFFYEEVDFTLKNPTKTKSWVNECIHLEKKSISSLSYIFCSDSYLLGINQEFLKHDTFTDTITFSYSTKPALIEGEVYISIDRVEENARKYAVTVEEEVSRVIIHGALHLCGYNDKKKSDQVMMKEKEEEYLILLHSKFHVKQKSKRARVSRGTLN